MSNLKEDEKPVKVTFYIEKTVAKEFKKRAIDEEKTYSELATLVLQEFIEKNRKSSGS